MSSDYLVVSQCCICCSPLLFCFVNFSFVDGSAGTIYACGDAIYDLIRPRDAQKLSLRLALTIHKSSVDTFFLFLSGRFYHHRQENAILNRANVQLMSGVCN